MRIDYTVEDFFFIEVWEASKIKDKAISHANQITKNALVHECDLIQMDLYLFYLKLWHIVLEVESSLITIDDIPRKVKEKQQKSINLQLEIVYAYTKKVGFIFDKETFKSILKCIENIKNLTNEMLYIKDVEGLILIIIETAEKVATGTNILQLPPWIQKQSELRKLFYITVKNACESDSSSFNKNKNSLIDKINSFSSIGISSAVKDLKEKIIKLKEYEIRFPSDQLKQDNIFSYIQILISSIFNEIVEENRLKDKAKIENPGWDFEKFIKKRKKNNHFEGRYCPYCHETPCQCSDPFK